MSGFSIGCHEAPVEKCLKITVNIMSAIIQVSAVVLPPPRTAAERRKIVGKLEKYFQLEEVSNRHLVSGLWRNCGIRINIHENF